MSHDPHDGQHDGQHDHLNVQPAHDVHAAHPAFKGGLLALLAAVLFGISTPLVQRAGAHAGAFTTAALLYGGAALMGAWLRRPPTQEAALRRTDLKRLAWMAIFGAAIGPVALAWGLQHTSGTSASLMLALEALFTAVLARALYRESMDHRVASAMGLLLLGGIVLVLDRGLSGGTQLLGLLAVLAATAAWGIDNTLSRALAERDPGQVVLGKSLLGVGATALLAVVAGESLPGWAAAVALLVIGACGYGLSLRLYLLAQRAFGAARTGSVFAFAPFIGALLAMALGDRSLSWGMAIGGALMLAGVALHLAESHAHTHDHAVLDHEHAHTHDDGHHDHSHDSAEDPVPPGAHSHPHWHTPLRHAHSHVPDAHHAHPH
ncbi:DMT family transporter [Variovorax sp. PAMC28562]|uniref:DMT family transporter n=1 Tax=Variovorax sp. PAMC28562 TaxID=2762323 RepID=UPI00164E58DF|nr:DMT family transporter [Variovorax sp. PAMC28562]QNK74630.1 DMT family transporter [Variovorax sp. PAMC28562]